MQKKQLILHIGYPKTGTTAIQSFLFQNRDELLNSGYYYPKTGISTYAHHQFPWSMKNDPRLKKKVDPKGLMSSLKNELEQINCSTVLMSSEGFIFAINPKYLLDYLSDLFDPITIIIYLREPLSWIESDYNQAVKGHRAVTKDFNSFFDSHVRKPKNPPINYFKTISKWAKVFNWTNLRIRSYHRDIDIFEDFLNTIGIKNQASYARISEKSNPRLSFKLLELARYVNQTQIPLNIKTKIISDLKKILPTETTTSNKLFLNGTNKAFANSCLLESRKLVHHLKDTDDIRELMLCLNTTNPDDFIKAQADSKLFNNREYFFNSYLKLPTSCVQLMENLC